MNEAEYGLGLKNEQGLGTWKGLSGDQSSKSRHANMGKRQAEDTKENPVLPKERQ